MTLHARGGAGALVTSTVVVVLCLGGCATVPVFRPIAPAFGTEQVIEAGVGPYAAFGTTEMGVGTSAWLIGQATPGFDVVLTGHGADFYDYAGSGAPLDDLFFGGGAGVRGTVHLVRDLTIGGEVFLEYEARTGDGVDEQLLLGHVGLPVSEKAFDNLWVYSDVILGIAIPLQTDRRGPFFGFSEVPIGVVWQALPWLLIAAEGGVNIPLAGGYGSVAFAFRL